jgi:hypothetical protein
LRGGAACGWGEDITSGGGLTRQRRSVWKERSRKRRIGRRLHIRIVTLAPRLPGPPPSPPRIPITAHDTLLDLEVVASLRLGVP